MPTHFSKGVKIFSSGDSPSLSSPSYGPGDQPSLNIHIWYGRVFRNPARFVSPSELQNPVGSRSGNRIIFNNGMHGLEFGFSGTGFLLHPTGSGGILLQPDWIWILCLLNKRYFCYFGSFMQSIYTESNRSQIACVMLVPDPEKIGVKNLQKRLDPEQGSAVGGKISNSDLSKNSDSDFLKFPTPDSDLSKIYNSDSTQREWNLAVKINGNRGAQRRWSRSRSGLRPEFAF